MKEKKEMKFVYNDEISSTRKDSHCHKLNDLKKKKLWKHSQIK